jgi:hypothetical protein
LCGDLPELDLEGEERVGEVGVDGARRAEGMADRGHSMTNRGSGASV